MGAVFFESLEEGSTVGAGVGRGERCGGIRSAGRQKALHQASSCQGYVRAVRDKWAVSDRRSGADENGRCGICRAEPYGRFHLDLVENFFHAASAGYRA